MHLRAVLTIAFACLAAVPLARAADCKSTVSGDLRIHSLTSRIFAKHTETAWAKRLPDALKFLFANWKPEVQHAGNQ